MTGSDLGQSLDWSQGDSNQLSVVITSVVSLRPEIYIILPKFPSFPITRIAGLASTCLKTIPLTTNQCVNQDGGVAHL